VVLSTLALPGPPRRPAGLSVGCGPGLSVGGRTAFCRRLDGRGLDCAGCGVPCGCWAGPGSGRVRVRRRFAGRARARRRCAARSCRGSAPGSMWWLSAATGRRGRCRRRRSPGVVGGEGCPLRAADGGDPAVESADGVAVCFAGGDHVRVGGGGEIEGQNLAGKAEKISLAAQCDHHLPAHSNALRTFVARSSCSA
jgi:hypothetical protein